MCFPVPHALQNAMKTWLVMLRIKTNHGGRQNQKEGSEYVLKTRQEAWRADARYESSVGVAWGAPARVKQEEATYVRTGNG